MKPRRSALALLALLTMLCGVSPALAANGPGGPSGRHTSTSTAPLDFAAVVPLPSDLGEGFLNNGGSYYLPSMLLATGQMTPEELTEQGFTGGLNAYFALPNAEDSTREDQSLTLFFGQYDSVEQARDFVQKIARPGSGWTLEAGAPDVGEDAVVWSGSGTLSGRSFEARSVYYHIANIAIQLTIFDYDGATAGLPRTDAGLAGLAEIVNQRLEAVQAGEYGGLSPMTLRLGEPTVDYPSVYEAYFALDGTAIPRYGFTDDVYATAISNGLIDGYESIQTIGAADSAHAVYVYLFRFKDDASAAAYVKGVGATMASQAETYSSFDPIADAPEFGDASAAFAYHVPPQDPWPAIEGKRIYAQVGSIVAAISLEDETEPPLDVAGQLLSAQLACLAAGACGEPIPFPS